MEVFITSTKTIVRQAERVPGPPAGRAAALMIVLAFLLGVACGWSLADSGLLPAAGWPVLSGQSESREAAGGGSPEGVE